MEILLASPNISQFVHRIIVVTFFVRLFALYTVTVTLFLAQHLHRYLLQKKVDDEMMKYANYQT